MQQTQDNNQNATVKIPLTGKRLQSILKSTTTLVQSWLPFDISDVEKLENGRYIPATTVTVQSVPFRSNTIPREWDNDKLHYKIVNYYYITPEDRDLEKTVVVQDDKITFGVSREFFTIFCDLEVSTIYDEVESLASRQERLEGKLKEYKANARKNIEAQEDVDSPLLFEEQELNIEQQRQARKNLDLVDPQQAINQASLINDLEIDYDNYLDYKKEQDFDVETKQNGRRLIGVNPVQYISTMRRPVGIDSSGKLWTEISLENMPFRELLKAGLAPVKYQVGDKIQVTTNKPGINAGYLTFDILGFDYDAPGRAGISHTISLGLHSVIYPKMLYLGGQEALGYFSQGLPPLKEKQAYTFKPGFLNYRFIPGQDVPKGAQIVATKFSGTTPVQGQFYADPLTPIGDPFTISIGSQEGDIDLGVYSMTAFGNVFSQNPPYASNLNMGNRVMYGNSDYSVSPVNTFLQSDEQFTQQWWKFEPGTNKFARFPFSVEGFLRGLEKDFVDLIIPVKKRLYSIVQETVDGVTQDVAKYIGLECTKGVFLPSAAELGFTYDGMALEETSIDRDGNIKGCYPYYQKIREEEVNEQRIKYDLEGNPAEYMLRSIYKQSKYENYYVTTGGSALSTYASTPRGISPIIVLGA